ncbi:hypothetical protein IV203_013343 [Nitzschia inconspicua]|uniref:Uncharacterized protein n=1 Tax=Nitzschia inconspicua TaxID=303405 RepID=A0A9K3Q7Z7_9STRA|nr:hypothetical protein IV203_013343 [Nitzschia inconspicua]
MPQRKSDHRIGIFMRCAAVAAMVMVFFLVFSFQHTFKLMEEHHERHVARDLNDHPSIMSHKVGTEPLEHEEMFTNTLKNCLPAEKGKECKTYIPESTERIGIIAPPGLMATYLFKLMNSVVAHGKKSSGSKVTNTTFEIIQTTHIPPYGYGKTHGYTRLVRVVPEPLLVGATDTLVATINNINDYGTKHITLGDIKSSLRQQIRYHCRLNHVAAHTALWTIGLEEVAEMRTEDLIDRVQEFLDLERDEAVADKIMEGEANKGGAEENLSNLEEMYSKGALLLSVAQSTNPGQDILEILDQVLVDEMRMSKNLTNWPCESFWKVGEAENPLELSPIIKRISQDLSPDCGAAFTDCFVQRDKCEYKGDGKCS